MSIGNTDAVIFQPSAGTILYRAKGFFQAIQCVKRHTMPIITNLNLYSAVIITPPALHSRNKAKAAAAAAVRAIFFHVRIFTPRIFSFTKYNLLNSYTFAVNTALTYITIR